VNEFKEKIIKKQKWKMKIEGTSNSYSKCLKLEVSNFSDMTYAEVIWRKFWSH